MSLFVELKRRNVFKVGIAYLVASWLILQLTEVLTELLEIGPEVGKIVIVLLVVGFLPALIFAWAFELTPEGIKREHEVDRSESIAPNTGRKLDFWIIGLLVIALGYFIWESRFAEKGSEPFSTDTAGARALEQKKDSDPVSPRVDERSIAVLPFANRSNLEDDSFFTDGIHDDLLTQLAKIRDLKVISRTSVMKYKGTDKSIPEIASELNVATILEGGVQRAGKRVRINAQLIDVPQDKHLWAETFDREMTVENIFDIQSEITRHIVQAVRGELTEEEQLTLNRIPTRNLEAYEAYLQAIALINRPDYAAENYVQAEAWARKAVELDPEFAQAWTILVETNGQAIWMGYDTRPERAAASKAALEKAMQYGSGLPEVMAAQAEYVYRVEEDFQQSLELYRKAQALLPGDPDILMKLGVSQRRTPDVAGAVESFLRAIEIDPLYSRAATTAAETLLNMDELDRLDSLLDRWVPRYPEAQDLRVSRVMTDLGRGNLEAALSNWRAIPPFASSAWLGAALEMPFFAKDFDSAIAVFENPLIQALKEDRSFVGLRELNTGRALQLLNRPGEAASELQACIELLTSTPRTGTYHDGFELIDLATAYALNGQPEQALAQAELAVKALPQDKNELFGTWVAQDRAQVLALAGERDAALKEIARLMTTPYKFNKWQLYLDPRWDFFRDDERFNELIRPDGAPEVRP